MSPCNVFFMEQNYNSGHPSRRDVLKASAGVPGFALAGYNLDNVSFISESRTKFVESVILFDGVPQSVPRNSNDGFNRYSVNDGELILLPGMRRSEIDRVVGADETIVKEKGMFSGNGEMIAPHARIPNSDRAKKESGSQGRLTLNRDSRSVQDLAIKSFDTLSNTLSVPLESPIQMPDYGLESLTNGVSIKNAESDNNLITNSKQEFPLSPLDVDIYVPPNNIDKQNLPANPEEASMRVSQGSVETITVQPKVVVKNHGEVDVKVPNKTLWEKSS